jgi:hypothetical protein
MNVARTSGGRRWNAQGAAGSGGWGVLRSEVKEEPMATGHGRGT